MKILRFDIAGKFAHFKKFYVNSSSLSYFFPPRTTVCGIIGAITGRERDSYYADFSIDKAKIGIRICERIRKSVFTVNYKSIKDSMNFENVMLIREHTQIPFEVILPQDFKNQVRYRIYFFHREKKIYEELMKRLEAGYTEYPVYMGISEFICKITDWAEIEAEKVKPDDKVYDIITVVNTEYIIKNGLIFSENLHYIKEKMPVDFNTNREISKVSDFIIELNQLKVRARLKSTGPLYRCDEGFILFME